MHVVVDGKRLAISLVVEGEVVGPDVVARPTRLRHVPSVPTLRDWLAAGPYTLAMSPGLFAFFAHAGLRVAGLPAARIRGELVALRREHVWDVRPGLAGAGGSSDARWR